MWSSLEVGSLFGVSFGDAQVVPCGLIGSIFQGGLVINDRCCLILMIGLVAFFQEWGCFE